MESMEDCQPHSSSYPRSQGDSQQPDMSNSWDPSPSSHPSFVKESTPPAFGLFSALPLEIRNQIWRATLTPRIVKWIRVNNKNSFDVPSRSLPLLSVNRESRDAAFFYGEYQEVSRFPRTMYFSPIIDYLFFDPGWLDLVGIQRSDGSSEPVQTLLPHFSNIRKIMVHPNYTDRRRTPTALFEKLRCIERVLVAADEKSIGFHSAHLSGTTYDIAKYYEATAKRRIPDIKKPHIAVGCLGWVGAERRKMHHGREDNRRLVAVFENEREIDAHAANLRREEWRFVQERFKLGRPKLVLNFRQRGEELNCQASAIRPSAGVDNPPSYSKAATEPDSQEYEPSTETGNSHETYERSQASGSVDNLQALIPGSDTMDELPDYDQMV